MEYSVTFENPCLLAALTIDPTILSTLSIEYSIGAIAHTEALDSTKVSSTETTVTCPSIVFSVGNVDGSSMDGSIFTFDSNTLTVENNLSDMAGVYELRLDASYDGEGYNLGGYLDFTVTLADSCAVADLTIDSNILTTTSITYSIYKHAHSETLSTSHVSSSETDASCPQIELNILNQDNSEIDTDVFTFD